MEDPIFQIAYQASRHSMMEELWQRMGPRERSALIYREMRRIDAGSAMPPQDAKPDDGFGPGAR